MSNKTIFQNSKNLFSSLLPKINDYFTKAEYLEKSKLSEFLTYIDLSLITEKEKDLEKLWSQLSKNSSSQNQISKKILIQNLSSYIQSHSSEIFQPEQTLKNSMLQFISNPKKLEINIDPDNEEYFELYHLLASLQYNNEKIIQIKDLKNLLNDYKFINLNEESLDTIIEDLVKEKVEFIKKEQYMSIMEEMSKKFGNLLEEKSNSKIVFTEEELNKAELKEFDDIDSFVKILFNTLNSICIIQNKFSENIKNKEIIDADYLNRYFNIFVENQKLFLFDIIKIYNYQKQKFNFYEYTLENKNIHYKQKIAQLNEEVKRQKDIAEIANIDNLKALNEEIIKEKNRYQKLENDIKSIKIEFEKKCEEQILLENKIMTLEKNIEEKQNKINSLKKENELTSQKYKEVLDTLDKQIFHEKVKEQFDDEVYKKMNLNDKQKLLIDKRPQELIAYIVEKDNYCLTLENKNKKLIEKITQMEKSQDDMDKNFFELKSKVLTLENKNSNLLKENEKLQKLVDEYQNKNGVFLNNLLEENDDDNEKKYNYIQVKNIQFNLKSISNKKKKINLRNYDYLCLKMNQVIIDNIEDEYYNATSNLFFSELINYLDEEKNITECALFITSEFIYLFNNITFHKGFSIHVNELKTVFMSPLNNYVSMTFYDGKILNFELIRILDLINFIKSLNALHKTNRPIELNMSEYNNQFVDKNPNNFKIFAYHGRGIYSGFIQKRVDGFLGSKFEKRFATLTEIGLVIMNKPNGKPLEIINLLFSECYPYNGGDGDYCFCLIIGNIKHHFSVDSEFIRNKWVGEILNWSKKIKDEESIMI